MSKGETCVKMEIIEPKYFMLKCKYIIPELSYETYLFDIINFLSDRPERIDQCLLTINALTANSGLAVNS